MVFVFLDGLFALVGFGTVGPGDGNTVGAVVGDGAGVGRSVDTGPVVECSVGA